MNYMAAAQNVRSGSSPVPTHDPDLRSRPPIQTFRKDLIQTFDPDLWNDIMFWWVVKPRCQAVKLPSCTCRKVTLLSSQAVQQPSCNCCTSKLSNCQADTVASCKASLPSSQAAHLLPAHLDVSPLLGRSRPGSRPIQTRSRPQPQPAPTQTTSSSVLKLVIVWFLSLLQIHNPSTLELMSTVPRVLTVKLNPKCEHYSLSMWPRAKPQTHVEIWCHIMKTWSSSWGLGNLWIMPLYVTPSFQTSGSPRDDPDGF